jgi:hypothetical protein
VAAAAAAAAARQMRSACSWLQQTCALDVHLHASKGASKQRLN